MPIELRDREQNSTICSQSNSDRGTTPKMMYNLVYIITLPTLYCQLSNLSKLDLNRGNHNERACVMDWRNTEFHMSSQKSNRIKIVIFVKNSYKFQIFRNLDISNQLLLLVNHFLVSNDSLNLLSPIIMKFDILEIGSTCLGNRRKLGTRFESLVVFFYFPGRFVII